METKVGQSAALGALLEEDASGSDSESDSDSLSNPNDPSDTFDSDDDTFEVSVEQLQSPDGNGGVGESDNDGPDLSEDSEEDLMMELTGGMSGAIEAGDASQTNEAGTAVVRGPV